MGVSSKHEGKEKWLESQKQVLRNSRIHGIFSHAMSRDLRQLWVCVVAFFFFLELWAEPSNVSAFVWGDKWKQILWNKSSVILADTWAVSRVCGPILKALLNLIKSACLCFKAKHRLPYLTDGDPETEQLRRPHSWGVSASGAHFTIPFSAYHSARWWDWRMYLEDVGWSDFIKTKDNFLKTRIDMNERGLSSSV